MANRDWVETSVASPYGKASRWQVIWQRLSVRLLLFLGILVFFTAVGVDSLQQAMAADMAIEAIAPVTSSSMNSFHLELENDHAIESADRAGTYLEFDPETSQRLRHSDLLSSQLIRSRLTSAHLFPSLNR